eukprot:176220-Prorocentrum_minimum.AAC.1
MNILPDDVFPDLPGGVSPAPYKAKLGAESKERFAERKETKKRFRVETAETQTESAHEAKRVARIAAGASEQRSCCEGCDRVFLCESKLASHVDVKGNTVDVKGNRVDGKGNRVDGKGNRVDGKGNRVDVKKERGLHRKGFRA